jgi:hypothetical protein
VRAASPSSVSAVQWRSSIVHLQPAQGLGGAAAQDATGTLTSPAASVPSGQYVSRLRLQTIARG